MTEHIFKPGELAWSPQHGFAKVGSAFPSDYAISLGYTAYTDTGRLYLTDRHPTLLTVEEAAKLAYFPPEEPRKARVYDACLTCWALIDERPEHDKCCEGNIIKLREVLE